MLNKNALGNTVYVVDRREYRVTQHTIVAQHKNQVIELDDGKKFCTSTGTLVNRYFKKYSKFLSRQPEINRYKLLYDESSAIRLADSFENTLNYMLDVDVLKTEISNKIDGFLEKYDMSHNFALKKQTILNLIDRYCND